MDKLTVQSKRVTHEFIRGMAAIMEAKGSDGVEIEAQIEVDGKVYALKCTLTEVDD